jgi:hypothetical protein
MGLYNFILGLIDEAYFVKKGYYFNLYFLYLMFIVSWSSTSIIYIVKNKSTHFYYFLCYNLLGLIIFITYDYILPDDSNSRPFELLGLLVSFKSAIIETIIPIVTVSGCVAVAQNIIGKKLLPAKYC